MRYELIDTPEGDVLVTADEAGLRSLAFQRGTKARTPPAEWERGDALLAEAGRQLRAYFAGRLHAFDLDLAPEGTPFQQTVWAALRAIPFGETRTYGELAAALGKPGASRAVGSANGRNPLAIVIPCHRVLAAGGQLGGYTGGLRFKRALLTLEGSLPGTPELPLPAARSDAAPGRRPAAPRA